MGLKRTEKLEKGILVGAAVLFFLLYLSLCFNDNVWTDEAFTIDLLKQDFGGILFGTASDVHPPLYYLIAKCFTFLWGSSLLSLKLVSILPILLCMSWGTFLARRRFGFFCSASVYSFSGRDSLHNGICRADKDVFVGDFFSYFYGTVGL